MGGGVIGIDLERGVNPASGLVVVALLVVDDPEQVQAVEMPGFGLQHLAVKRLGFRQPARLVQRQRLCEQHRVALRDRRCDLPRRRLVRKRPSAPPQIDSRSVFHDLRQALIDFDARNALRPAY